ncbi:MAG: biotin transporter BioY [Clostridia bacterium]|nr:biotin transporter BioY [Clostridia bacterium]
MKTKKSLAVDIAEIAIFVALMVVGAWVQIPFYPVPLTFQTVFAVLSGLLLGWKKGVAAMSVYMFMGFVCFIPVFSDHSLAGFAYALKPSFGYIIGFVLSALVGGLIMESGKFSLKRCIVAAVAAFITDYLIGVPYFAGVWHFFVSGKGLGVAMVTYNVVYMPKDLVLSVLAALLAWKVVPVLSKDRTAVKLKKEKITGKDRRA